MVLPQIKQRSDNDLAILNTGNVDFDYLFDSEFFKSSFATACPQMHIYNSTDELKPLQSPTDPPYRIDALQTALQYQNGIAITNPELWRASFDEWFDLTVIRPPSSSSIVVVGITTPFLQFPLARDSQEFTNNFGRIIRFRHDTRVLAAKALYELSRAFDLNLDPAREIHEDAYLGAHLRTADDALRAGWTGYDVQAELYINAAYEAGISLIYVSSGSKSDMLRFREQAWEAHGINVTTKDDLLTGDDLEVLQAMTWDEQALIDYEILLKSSQFVGIAVSSFSWNVALRRHARSTDNDYLGKGQALMDELSVVFGTTGIAWPGAMWP